MAPSCRALDLEFCGKLALLQTQLQRYWFCETSYSTWLWTMPYWQMVNEHPGTLKEVIRVKKPTMVSSNSPEIMYQFKGLQSPQLREIQVWNWPFVNRLVQGIVNLKARVRRSAGRTAYNVDKGNYPCIGCDSGLPKGRSEHNRVEGECKHFDADPSEIEEPLTCPGCI